ncbi:hypothetical protein [Amycolatopsis sp. cg9]|uniref:hypothetical protein n=1 Tax=Amycolatopsis sp. cg9 TaxID=3238801 RepID=UPI003526938C
MINGLELRRTSVTDRGPDTFSSTQRVVLRPSELTPATVPEFLGTLRLVLDRSGLTAGQVAAKTSIARSSAYNLVASGRTGLPTGPGQVRLFLSGCGLRLDQVDTIMVAWTKLSAGELLAAAAWARRLAQALLTEHTKVSA